MGDTILHTRGLKANEPVLPAGRIGVILDERQIIAGGNDGNIYAARQEDVDKLKNKMDQLLNSAGGGKINFIINSDFRFSQRHIDYKTINGITFPKDRFYLTYVGNDGITYNDIPNGLRLDSGDGSKWTLGQTLYSGYVNKLKDNNIIFKFKARGTTNLNYVIQYNLNNEIRASGEKTVLKSETCILNEEWNEYKLTVQVPSDTKGLAFEIQSVINSSDFIETKEWQVEIVNDLNDNGSQYNVPDPRLEIIRCEYFYKSLSPCGIPFIVNKQTGFIPIEKQNIMRTNPVCHVPNNFYIHYYGETNVQTITQKDLTVSANCRILNINNIPSSYNGRFCVLTNSANIGTFSGTYLFIELDAELI